MDFEKEEGRNVAFWSLQLTRGLRMRLGMSVMILLGCNLWLAGSKASLFRICVLGAWSQ